MEAARKIMGMLSMGLLVGAMVVALHTLEVHGASVDSAGESDNGIIQEELEYTSYRGEIIGVNPTGHEFSILVKGEDASNFDQIIFNIHQDLYILDQDDKGKISREQLQEGDMVEAYYRKDSSMTLSIPPMMVPDFIVMTDYDLDGFVFHGTFDRELVDIGNSLKLNISGDTPIISHRGKDLEPRDLMNGELLVFYNITTRSIPAQVNPQMVVALDYHHRNGIVEDGKYVNEKYGISFMVPDFWEGQYKLVLTEEDVSAIKLQVDFRFEPEGHFLELKENIISIFAIEESGYGQDFMDTGFVEVARDEYFVYAVKTPEFSMYQKGQIGELRTRMSQSLEDLDNMLVLPVYSLEAQVQDVIKEHGYDKDGITLMPLRKVAELLGYDVEWIPSAKGVVLRRGNATFTLALGQEVYGHNKSQGRFEIAPEITQGRTYVPSSFLDIMK